MLKLSRDSPAYSELRTIVFDCTKVVYNRQRHQRGLGDSAAAEMDAANTAA